MKSEPLDGRGAGGTPAARPRALTAEAQRRRDTSVLRRGLGVGALVWLLGAATLVGVALRAGGGGRPVLLGLTLAGALAVVVVAAWLLVAGLLDALADRLPGRRRLMWTAAVTLAAFLTPMLVLGAAGVSPT